MLSGGGVLGGGEPVAVGPPEVPVELVVVIVPIILELVVDIAPVVVGTDVAVGGSTLLVLMVLVNVAVLDVVSVDRDDETLIGAVMLVVGDEVGVVSVLDDGSKVVDAVVPTGGVVSVLEDGSKVEDAVEPTGGVVVELGRSVVVVDDGGRTVVDDGGGTPVFVLVLVELLSETVDVLVLVVDSPVVVVVDVRIDVLLDDVNVTVLLDTVVDTEVEHVVVVLKTVVVALGAIVVEANTVLNLVFDLVEVETKVVVISIVTVVLYQLLWSRAGSCLLRSSPSPPGIFPE
jgi:hypothetical protein